MSPVCVRSFKTVSQGQGQYVQTKLEPGHLL